MTMRGPSIYSYPIRTVSAAVAPILSSPLYTLLPYHTYYMDRIEDLPNSDLHIPFLRIPPSLRGILNYGVGEYYVAGAGRFYEVQ